MPDWFVLNLSESPAGSSPRTGTWTEFEPPGGFDQYGVNVHVVMPGQANCLYHAESEQEDFLNASAAETTSSGREAYRDFPPESHGERFLWPLTGSAPEARG